MSRSPVNRPELHLSGSSLSARGSGSCDKLGSITFTSTWMTIYEDVELATSNLTDGLLFRVVWKDSRRAWAFLLTKHAVLGLIVWLVLSLSFRPRRLDVPLFVSLYIGLCAPGVLTRWLQGCVTEVHFTRCEIDATGNLGSNVFSKRVVIPSSSVESLRWYSGGLHLERAWRPPIRVLPVTKESCEAVLKAILNRFPEEWEEHHIASSLSGTIALRPARFCDRKYEGKNTELDSGL